MPGPARPTAPLLPSAPMSSAPVPPEQTRRILDLARGDPEAASARLAALSPEARLALVCDSPLALRAKLLELMPEPESVIPALPEAELCFTVKALGLSDAVWILEHASAEQVTASLDLDVWKGSQFDPATANEWMDALARIPETPFARDIAALDPELLVLLLKSRIRVVQKPPDDEGWQPPDGGQTLEGQFYFVGREGDDLDSIVTLLRRLFEADYWSYFRLMQGVIWELDSDTEEWALRWRNGRLEDLGFPGWEESMSIYRFLGPEERARLPEGEQPLAVDEWHLPVWVPALPDLPGREFRVFRAIARLEDEERRACFYAFIALANRIAVADRMPLSDAESTPRAIEKAARFASAGLEFLAAEHGLDDAEVLRRVSLSRLFSVGANLDPSSARP